MKPHPASLLRRYAHWLHLRWPEGVPEALPETQAGGRTAVPGVRIAGDLLGVPLLKFAADSGARAVQEFIAEGVFAPAQRKNDELDLVIVGGGVAGLSAALEARKGGLRFRVYEASAPFSTIHNFTHGKPIFTYPSDMQPAGGLNLTARVKEELLAHLQAQAERAEIPFEHRRVERVRRQGKALEVAFADGHPPVRARRVLICTGKSGDHYTLDVPGENLDKVHYRLFDPKDYRGQKVLVVGGGDTALETAAALAEAKAEVTLAHRGQSFSRPKAENVERVRAQLGENIRYGTRVTRIEEEQVWLRDGTGKEVGLANDAVFVCIGREAPVTFFHRSGIAVRGHWSARKLSSLAAVLAVVWFVYRWKTEGSTIADAFLERGWFPYNLLGLDFGGLGTLLGEHLAEPGFHYELLYTLVIALFGVRRVARYRTPYVFWQTLSLALVQLIPLFLLPYFILPGLGQAGWFDDGAGAWLADQLFPFGADGISREYWRSVGFILAWPLFIWNVFTPAPSLLWLVIALLQTFVLIPWLVHRYGKGAYCGWICSCGALAETLGDAHRGKMPHGPIWNRLNLSGQVILALAFLLLALRAVAWATAGSGAGAWAETVFAQATYGFSVLGLPLNYSAVVDYFLSGLLGLGLYFHFSGRTWCRFFCPLAALMHVYARFSRFRTFADQDKCISCNVCTSVCHQGIDIMSFANKGQPMEDPQCVRCSACVYHCPTGVLSFGYLNQEGTPVRDKLKARPHGATRR
jgi:thioredoxin reductase/ferredoxin